jgi:hypothetical protein
MSPRFFTVEEANGLLPAVEPLVRSLLAKRQELRGHQQALGEFRARASRDGGALPGSTFAQAKSESARLIAEIHEGVRQIESWGCMVQEGFAGRKPLEEDAVE